MPRAGSFETQEDARYRQRLDAVCAGILERGTNGHLTFVGDRIVSRFRPSTRARTALSDRPAGDVAGRATSTLPTAA